MSQSDKAASPGPAEYLSLPVEHWKEYRELRLRALREDPEAFSSVYATARDLPDDFWQGRLAKALQGEKEWLLFGRDQGRLVGMIGAFVEEGSPDTATIVSVYVPKEERGKGISRRLMEEMLMLLSEKPGLRKARLAVNVSQLAAVRLYEKFGFQEVGREPAETGEGKPVEQMIMERPLGSG